MGVFTLLVSLEPMDHRQNLATLSLVCRPHFSRWSSELVKLFPFPYSRGVILIHPLVIVIRRLVILIRRLVIVIRRSVIVIRRLVILIRFMICLSSFLDLLKLTFDYVDIFSPCTNRLCNCLLAECILLNSDLDDFKSKTDIGFFLTCFPIYFLSFFFFYLYYYTM